MDIAANPFNLQKRIDYALANLKQNDPDLFSKMSWHWMKVGVTTRLRRCAGRCSYWRTKDELKVEFSVPLFNKIGEMDKTDVVIHELAHAICFRLKLDTGHGEAFKRVCRLMGGSGDRCLDLPAGTVKRNLVKRWVCVKRDNVSKLYLRTRKGADLFMCAVKDALLLGVIQLDQNEKTVKWTEVISPSLSTINPMESSGGWKVVA